MFQAWLLSALFIQAYLYGNYFMVYDFRILIIKQYKNKVVYNKQVCIYIFEASENSALLV